MPFSKKTFSLFFLFLVELFLFSPFALAQTTSTPQDYTTPTLSIEIPTVSFSQVVEKGNSLEINFIGEYFAGIYQYVLGIAITIATVMLMVGGLQYILSAGKGSAQDAMKRISQAVIGLVLLFCTVLILVLVNPSLTSFKPLLLTQIEQIIHQETAGEEGASSGGTTSSCQQAKNEAKKEGECEMTEKIASPTGSSYSCNYHFRDSSYDYEKITSLDYAASWNTAIKASFSGKVEYLKGTGSSRCGNKIRLTGSEGSITLCHAKDFLNTEGKAITSGTFVQKGDMIGHVGGRCCNGQKPPSTWSQANKCTVEGTACTDPTKNENCDCQSYLQSGNTSGPHVHMTFNYGGNLLACLE